MNETKNDPACPVPDLDNRRIPEYCEAPFDDLGPGDCFVYTSSNNTNESSVSDWVTCRYETPCAMASAVGADFANNPDNADCFIDQCSSVCPANYDPVVCRGVPRFVGCLALRNETGLDCASKGCTYSNACSSGRDGWTRDQCSGASLTVTMAGGHNLSWMLVALFVLWMCW